LLAGCAADPHLTPGIAASAACACQLLALCALGSEPETLVCIVLG
jgi:hypothetical protein